MSETKADRHKLAFFKEEAAIVVAFRQMTLLPLDDCLDTLQSSLPNLTRSALHRCFQRHGVSRLPDVEGKPVKKKFKIYPIGYFHIDIAEVQTEEGKLYLFVAIDRTSKFASTELHEQSDRKIATAFLQGLIAAVPYTIHTVLTDNGSQFCHAPRATAMARRRNMCATCSVKPATGIASNTG